MYKFTHGLVLYYIAVCGNTVSAFFYTHSEYFKEKNYSAFINTFFETSKATRTEGLKENEKSLLSTCLGINFATINSFGYLSYKTVVSYCTGMSNIYIYSSIYLVYFVWGFFVLTCTFHNLHGVCGLRILYAWITLGVRVTAYKGSFQAEVGIFVANLLENRNTKVS